MEDLSDLYKALKQHKDYKVFRSDDKFITAEKGVYNVWADDDCVQFYKGRESITHIHPEDFTDSYMIIAEFLDAPEQFVKNTRRDKLIINAIILLGMILFILWFELR